MYKLNILNFRMRGLPLTLSHKCNRNITVRGSDAIWALLGLTQRLVDRHP
jgi:hypothetical protein